MESSSTEFYFLKTKPHYPKAVKAVAIAHLYYDTKAKRLYFDRPKGSQWVASLWILDESCQVDLAMVLKQDKLEFMEASCFHGELCPNVEKVKRAVLESESFSELRKDLIHHLSQGVVADPDPAHPLPSRKGVAPSDGDGDVSP